MTLISVSQYSRNSAEPGDSVEKDTLYSCCTLGHVYLRFSQASVSPTTLGAMLEALSKTPTLLIKERKGKPTAKGYFHLLV